MPKAPKRIRLADLPTLIQKLERVSREVGSNIYVWRDDLTGFVESGNKIRKLEFLLADALEKAATAIITCGGPQSNHSRATAFSARKLGLKVSIIIREPKGGLDHDAPPTGNLLLNKICRAKFKFIPFGSPYEPSLKEEAAVLRSEGEEPYIICEGGSDPVGVFGYLTAVPEMLATWKKLGLKKKGPDSIFSALGSGGTMAGLHLGCEMNGISSEKVFAVNVCHDRKYFEERVGKLLDDTCRRFSFKCQNRKLQIFDGYVGEGYAMACDEDLRLYSDIAQKEGLLLDPCYTGKTFKGMLSEIKKDPQRFGKDILFLHTGGGFGNFAYSSQYRRLFTADQVATL